MYCAAGVIYQYWVSAQFPRELYPDVDSQRLTRVAFLYAAGFVLSVGLLVVSCVRALRNWRRRR